MTDRLLTLNEIAANLHCTISAVRRWRRENRIATIKIGRLVRVADTELDRITKEGLRPATRGTR